MTRWKRILSYFKTLADSKSWFILNEEYPKKEKEIAIQLINTHEILSRFKLWSKNENQKMLIQGICISISEFSVWTARY